MKYVLDTSALLAHYLEEPGADQVSDLFGLPFDTVSVSVLTVFEFEVRLVSEGVERAVQRQVWERYESLFAEVVPVTLGIAKSALLLRSQAKTRIATADCLIAATAVATNAVLVHRDAHFLALPEGMPNQLALAAKHKSR